MVLVMESDEQMVLVSYLAINEYLLLSKSQSKETALFIITSCQTFFNSFVKMVSDY